MPQIAHSYNYHMISSRPTRLPSPSPGRHGVRLPYPGIQANRPDWRRRDLTVQSLDVMADLATSY